MAQESYKLNLKLLPLPAGDADKLIAAADGDAALLYLYLLRSGEGAPADAAASALGMPKARMDAAAARLRAMALMQGGEKPLPAADELPEYTAEEVAGRSAGDSAFRGVLSETEALLGRSLSGADLKTLFGIYDHLGLPPEVMLLMIHHCAEDCRERYGEGRVPTVRQLEKEAYFWANREIMTMDAAEDFLREKKLRRGAEAQVRRALGIRDREPTSTERRYIDSWLGMDFPPEAVELALDRTVANTGALKWSYMDKILQSWHSKGLHSPEEIAAGDGRSPRKSAAQSPAPRSGDELERMKKIYDKVRNGR